MSPRISRRPRALGLAVLVGVGLALAACGDLLQEPDTGFAKVAARLEEVSGNGQTGAPGAVLSQPVRVRVLDDDENPVARLRVEWTVIGGSGRVDPRNSFSDGEGIAEATWTLGPESGSQQIQASVRKAVPMIFDAMAVTP